MSYFMLLLNTGRGRFLAMSSREFSQLSRKPERHENVLKWKAYECRTSLGDHKPWWYT